MLEYRVPVRPLVIGLLCLAGSALLPAAVPAGTVYFNSGRGMTIDSMRIGAAGQFEFGLPGGGEITVAIDSVARVVMPRPPEEAPAAAEKNLLPADNLEALISDTARSYGIDERLVLAMVEAESAFDPGAISAVGAVGLMQLMPATAADLQVDEPLDPAQNVDGGVRYLKWMLERFDGDQALALAAYNAGPAAVRRYGGIPPFPETQRYVDRVLDLARR